MTPINYNFVTKEEIQEFTYLFLQNFIKTHLYISVRSLLTSVGEHFGYSRKHKDISGKVFYRKLSSNIRIILKMMVNNHQILRKNQKLYVKNVNKIL